MNQATSVAVVGQGKIAAPVIDWLKASPAFAFTGIIDRSGNLPAPASLVIECAGPGALRQHGAALLQSGDLWSVGAAALADDGFLQEMQTIALRTGHRLRLFTGWIGGVDLMPRGTQARLHIEQAGPGLAAEPGVMFDGPLTDAAQRYPKHLNTACAAALTGPGIRSATLKLISSPAGGDHYIRSVLEMPGSTIRSEVDLSQAHNGPNPVSAAIIAALKRRGHWLEY